MKVAVYPADRYGCGHLRLIWPAERLIAQGHQVAIERPAINVRYSRPWNPGAERPPADVQILRATVDADVVVVQRPHHAHMLDIIPALQAEGVRVVVEVDDNFDQIDPENGAWRSAQVGWMTDSERLCYERDTGIAVRVTKTVPGWSYCPDLPSIQNKENLRTAIGLADHLVVTTPALAHHYGKLAKGVSVVPNFIPAAFLRLGEFHKDHAVPVIGWAGAVSSHPKDLPTVGDGLRNLTRPHLFRVIGPIDGVVAGIKHTVNGATGMVPIAEYPSAYATIDIAICPLADTKFNRAKSWLKPLEAAALGVVPVMSPLPEYLALNAMGIGLVARNPKEWTAHLEDLLGSPLYRHELRRKGLEVAAGLTIEGNAERFLDAWTGASRPTQAVATDPQW